MEGQRTFCDLNMRVRDILKRAHQLCNVPTDIHNLNLIL